MARIRNVELPKEKRTVIGLTYIYGIGRSLSEKICANTGVDPDKKIKDLTSEDEAKLRKEIENHLTEGDLRREVQMNIKNKMETILIKVLDIKKDYLFMVKEQAEMLRLVKVKAK